MAKKASNQDPPVSHGDLVDDTSKKGANVNPPPPTSVRPSAPPPPPPPTQKKDD